MAGVDARRLDGQHAEASEQGRVPLLDLAHPFGRGRRKEANLTAKEHRLEQVADAAADSALTEQRVDPVDIEENVLALGFERSDELAQALFDFAAELCPSDEQSRLELEEFELCEGARHVSRRDSHRQRADDGRLADSRLADQERMILLPSLENLKKASHLDVASDHRVDLTVARSLDEVVREPRQHLAARRCPGRRNVARHALERGHVRTEASRPEAERLEHHGGGSPNLLREGIEQMFDFDSARPRLLLSALEKRKHCARQVGQARSRLPDAPEG